MNIDDRQEREIKSTFKNYVNKAKALLEDKEGLEGQMKKAWSKVKNLDPQFEHLADSMEIFIALVRDYIRGEYRNVSNKSLIMIIGGLLYFVNPFDIIPDMIPIIGFADDAALVIYLLKQIQKEIEIYRDWKSGEARG